MDSKNLKKARMAREDHHDAYEHHESHADGHHVKHESHKHKSHKGAHHKDPRHLTAHDREVDRENLRSAHRSHSIHGGHYAGAEPRRRQELEDAGMIHEDHSAIANMPQGVIMKSYPMDRYYLPEGLDDTLRGVDRQMDYDGEKRVEHERPHKY